MGNSNPSGWIGARDGLTIFCKIPIGYKACHSVIFTILAAGPPSNQSKSNMTRIRGGQIWVQYWPAIGPIECSSDIIPAARMSVLNKDNPLLKLLAINFRFLHFLPCILWYLLLIWCIWWPQSHPRANQYECKCTASTKHKLKKCWCQCMTWNFH